MKTILDTINEALTPKFTNLQYVMTFDNFKTWLNKQDKDDSFIIYALEDQEYDVRNLIKDNNQQIYIKYDSENKSWVGENGYDDDIIVDEFTLDDNDIILIFDMK